MTPEREVLAQMGIKGFGRCIEAIADLLISMGYHDAAKELRERADEGSYEDED